MRWEHWLYTAPLRLRSIFKSRQVDAELEEELQYHIDRKTEEFIAQGLNPAQARHSAMRAMDGLTQQREECRDTRGINLIDNLVRDIRYGFRSLTKAPGFSMVAILTLAAGIGANTAIFSVINAVLLQPLNYPDPDRIVQLMLYSPGWAIGRNANTASIPEYNVLREQTQTFDSIAAYDTARGFNLTSVDPAEQVRAMHVSAARSGKRNRKTRLIS